MKIFILGECTIESTIAGTDLSAVHLMHGLMSWNAPQYEDKSESCFLVQFPCLLVVLYFLFCFDVLHLEQHHQAHEPPQLYNNNNLLFIGYFTGLLTLWAQLVAV